jgi:hypothetical protein
VKIIFFVPEPRSGINDYLLKSIGLEENPKITISDVIFLDRRKSVDKIAV